MHKFVGKKTPYFAGIEAGGTTFVATIAKAHPTNIIEQKEFPTLTPQKTVSVINDWLDNFDFQALGIASFGPVDLDKKSKTYGHITTTPKPNWDNFDIVGAFRRFGVPIGFETDVNAAAMGEFAYGEHGNIKSCTYVTAGTGIGVGAICDGKPVHGLMHPELGHCYSPRAENEYEKFKGTCPRHGSCLEGMCNAGAISHRLNIHPSKLPQVSDDHEVWDIVSHYFSHLCTTITLSYSPNVIILGGGVFKREILYDKIRKKTLQLLNGYVGKKEIVENIDSYIVPPKFKSLCGAVGSLELARIVFEQSLL
ncbi:transcriptional repressor mpra [Anaeramoeba flamelloides]|uniref:fructokinase n=1 Tax=Anaeramoeba flamelloides TaxID=1746091 RepID=A0ABQ8YGE2_9EUKA|nr:transcriptional repressor mpra [Anaeramoeba flamelloides]